MIRRWTPRKPPAVNEVHRVIGIDPGLTRTGVAIGKSRKGKLIVLKHLVIGAEGKTWFDRCDNIAERVKNWILVNTNDYDVLHIMVEDVYGQGIRARAWPSAIQNRLLGCIVGKLKSLSNERRVVFVCSIVATTVKKMFTGYGRAEKEDIIDQAKKYYRFKNNYSKANRECLGDAIAITWCGWKFFRAGVDMKGINSV